MDNTTKVKGHFRKQVEDVVGSDNTPAKSWLLDIPDAKRELGTRAFNALFVETRYSLTTKDSFIKETEVKLSRIPNVGAKSLSKILAFQERLKQDQ